MAIEIPAGVGRAEAALRRKHVAALSEHAKTAPAEHARYLAARGQRITRAMPVRDYIERRRKLQLAATEAGSALDWSEGKPISVASGYRAMIQALDKNNEYPPGLVPAVERRLLGGSPCADPALSATVEEAVARKGQ